MTLEELVIGVNKADFDERRELKVKVPVRTLVHLQFVKLTEGRGISEVVNQALNEFFAARTAESRARNKEPQAGST